MVVITSCSSLLLNLLHVTDYNQSRPKVTMNGAAHIVLWTQQAIPLPRPQNRRDISFRTKIQDRDFTIDKILQSVPLTNESNKLSVPKSTHAFLRWIVVWWVMISASRVPPNSSMDWGWMIFCWGSTTPKLLQQAVKYSGCSSFVWVKDDNPADIDDDSGFHVSCHQFDGSDDDISSISYRLETWLMVVQYASCASVYYKWMPKKQA